MRKKSVGVTNDNAKSSTSTAYQRGNNRDGSPHYVFLYSDNDDDDDDNDNNDDDNNENNEISHANKYDKNIPLQLRGNKLQKNICPRKVEVITVTLKPEDTLQALSLRYRCTISELKRINNIHKENEIFARRIIKVPVPPFSILSEINKESSEQQIKNESTNKTIGIIDINNSIVSGGDAAIINNEEQNEIIIFPSISSSNNNNNTNNNNNSSNSDDINSIILNSLLINPMSNNSNDNFEIDDNENEELLLINERDRDSTTEARVIELFGCSGADWGLTWIHLLGASLILCFVLPVIYYLTLTEHHQYIHLNNSSSS